MYQRLRALIEKKQITIYKLCKEVNISKSTIYAWRNGDYTPKVDKLQKIADYFGVPLDYFYKD